MANGLRSLKQAYEVWKQAKQTPEESRSEESVPTFSPEDPDADIKRDEYIQDLQERIRDLENDLMFSEATNKSLRKHMENMNARRGRRRKPKNDNNQRTVIEYWPQVAQETEGD